MPRDLLERRLARLLDKAAAHPLTGTVRFAARRPATDWRWQYDDGGPFFVASITKTYTAAIVLQLVDEGALRLEDRLVDHLDPALTDGLHVLDGVDRTSAITLGHLLTQTSGLPDHWADARDDGTSLWDEVRQRDTGWTLVDTVAIARDRQVPLFPPGAPGKAHYSDTNFDLLGGVVAAVTGQTYAESVARRIARRAGLEGTYVFGPEHLERFADVDAIYDRGRPLDVPCALAACQASGGIVSTSSDSLRFLEAFMSGELFDAAHLRRIMSDWRRVFGPFRYGGGVMRLALPRMLSKVPPLVGHAGSTGTALFRCEDLDLDLSLAVNQTTKPAFAARLLMRLADEIRRG